MRPVSTEDGPRIAIQFFKYGVAGAVATGVHLLIFTALNETILPAGVDHAGAERGWNFFWSFSIAFCLANVVGFVANRYWVFEPGRHGRWTEFGLFYLVAFTAYLLGTPLGAYLVGAYPFNEYIVYVVVAIISILVNFTGRKFIVFQR